MTVGKKNVTAEHQGLDWLEPATKCNRVLLYFLVIQGSAGSSEQQFKQNGHPQLQLMQLI